MNILAFCSALDKTYLALLYDNKMYSKIIKSDENYHSLYLLDEIKKIFDQNSLSFNKLDLIVSNKGPGSFTGIRVSLTAAKVMAGELNIPLVGLNSSEILLKAYNRDLLIMDARRDMYYVAFKDEIKLVPKENINSYNQNLSVLCDKRSADIFADSLCFEDNEKDLGSVMITLAKEKYSGSLDKEEFNPLKLEADYIQTPPVF